MSNEIDDEDEDDVFEVAPLPEYEVDPRWSTALPDWEERIKTGRTLIPDLPLDQHRADKALRLFKQLRMPDIRGRPTYGEACDQFIFDLVRAIFGAFDAETQARMIREYFLLIPKKNGKTSIAAAIMVVAMIMNERPDAELVLIAPTIKIANRSFKQAVGIILLTVLKSGVSLSDLFTDHKSERVIRYLNDGCPSEMAIIAADTDVVTGSKGSYVLIDETHEFAKKPRANEIFTELRGGLSHEDNTGFMLQITTQSKNPPSGQFKAELGLARDVRDGRQTYPMLAVLYELPAALAKNDGWKRRETWRMVNPHLGRSVSEPFLMQQLSKAEAEGKTALALLASQHFNVEIGIGMHADIWPGAAYWEAAALPGGLTLDDLIERSEVIVVAADGGGSDDLFGFAAIGRENITKNWLLWSHAWCRPIVFERRKEIASRLLDFEKLGELTVCKEPDQDLNEVAAICLRIMNAGLFPKSSAIGLDQHGGANVAIDKIVALGIPADLMDWVGQAYKLQPANVRVERMLESKTFLHAGQELMSWCVGNAKQEMKSSNYVITKAAAGTAKIDPVVAMLDAAMLMALNPVASGRGIQDYLEHLRGTAA